MSGQKIWRAKDTTVSNDFIQECGGSKILAVLLKNRGIDTKEKASNFLNPLKMKLSSPDVFTDIQKAVDRIEHAVQTNEHITVYGDFDADGVTSTALLYLTLKKIGADVSYYLPDRGTESHGLNTKALVNIIAKKKTKLIITVDCGISNISEVNFAKGFKTDIIITDHHEAGKELPCALAVLNPKAADSIDNSLSFDEIQSLNYLSGAGVAFKLACKLLEIYNCQDFVHEILPIAAVGTVGDVVELIGENRSIVSMGLELLKSGRHKGIQKILKSMGITDFSNITSDTIAFGIVPRLNAAGRLESPYTALSVLISDNDDELDNSVKTLNDLNTLRQELCDETFNAANEMYQNNLSDNTKSIVLLNDNWHIGIIGIVSSKLVETYNKPVFLMTRDCQNTNIIRCSCRSIEDLNIHSLLSTHKELFEGFGGHKMAAGFSFDENKISFENFKKELNKTIDQFTQNIDFNKTYIDYDMDISPADITVETVKMIDKMQPFGAGNPSPLFAMKNTILKQYKMMGQNNNHLKLFVSQNNSSMLECVKWNYPDFNLPVNTPLDILFALKLNSFNDNISVQLILFDIYSELLNQNNNLQEIKILDHRNKKDILMQVLDFILNTKKITAVYIENDLLIKQLKIPDYVLDKVFSINNIPKNIEQLMFFDVPASKDDFFKILKDTNAKIVHLMNFNFCDMSVDAFITKLSGMLKYAVSGMNGQFNIRRAAMALNVNNEIVECALDLFEDSKMIELDRNNNENYIISYMHPVELSKIKSNVYFDDFASHLNEINAFRNFYFNSSIAEIKESLLC